MSYRPEKNSIRDSIGEVLELFISKKSVDRMLLDKKGVINDKFYAKDIDRSVLISSIDSYKLAQDRDIELDYGQLGENILIDYNPYRLKSGARIQIGEAILEISQNCTLCKSLTKIDNKLPKLLKDDRGIFAKVIKAGEIKERDKIYLIKN